ncbi:MAG: FAD-binding oxidoreductase [Methylobacteriaceae bacterium]|nr:FAD-binding oxidoreductase [Methylobacteriaceae bacterium]
MSERRSADVLIVGGGIHGCSTALHCALRGLSVILFEKDHAGRHASGVNAGGVRQLLRDVAEIPLSIASMELWLNIAALVEDDCGFVSEGQILVAEDEAELEIARARVADLRLRGFTHEELIDARELRRLAPAVAETCPGGVVSRRDGAAIPLRATQAFKRRAAALGAVICENERVERVARESGVFVATTPRGVYRAPVLVNAAGAWGGALAASLGEVFPVETIAPMLMITTPMPAFIRPVVILRGRKLSFKQFDNGTVLIGGGHLGKAIPEENRTILDWRKLAVSAQTVWDVFPIMRSATIARAWAGIEARMADDLPAFGPSRLHEGLFHQFGFSAHGFQLGPGAGAVMAELIATGATNTPIDGLSPARFARAPG